MEKAKHVPDRLIVGTALNQFSHGPDSRCWKGPAGRLEMAHDVFHYFTKLAV
jgi:hypothetical protein